MLLPIFFSISKLRSSTKRLNSSEALLFIDSLRLTKPVKFTLSRNPNEDTCAIFNTHTIIINHSDLFKEVILHELGHLESSLVPGTANYKIKELEKLSKKDKVSIELSKDLVIESEEEAWDWALKANGGDFGRRSTIAMNLCLKSYKAINQPIVINYIQ